MNSEEQAAPPPGVAVVSTPEGVNTQEPRTGRRRRRRNRNRNRRRGRERDRHRFTHTPVTTHSAEDRPAVTEGTQLHQARQNHSTYDRDLHHRAKGGTGYGYRRDLAQPTVELQGDQLPPGVLPSYEHILIRAGVLPTAPPEPQDD